LAFYSEGDLDSLVEGLKDLRTGALLEILSVVMLIVAFIPLFTMFPTPDVMGRETMPPLGLMITQALLILALVFIAVALSIVSFYKFYKAASHFKDYDPSRLGIGKTGVTLTIIAIVILIVSLLVMMGAISSMAPSSGLRMAENLLLGTFTSMIFVMLIAAILALVGSILFGIMIMRLGEVEGLEPGFRTAGIIYIVSIVISLIPFIAVVGFVLSLVSLILIYSYSGSSLKALGAY